MAGDEVDPEEERQWLAGAGERERIAYVRTERWITYPRAAAILDQMQLLLDHPRNSRMPSLLIVGESGIGKTQLDLKFCRDHPPGFDEKNLRTVSPVVSLQMPAAATDRLFYMTLLRAVGAIFSPRITTAEAMIMVLRLYADLGVRMVIFDETHNMLSGTFSDQRRILTQLRYLSRAVSQRSESQGIPESGLFMIHEHRRVKEAAGMALSEDLRTRVVEAVVVGGLSRNAAAKRFGVSIASAIRWVWRFQATGEISPAPTGGDRRSDRIEAHGDYLLGPIGRQPDVTLLEIQERLIANCGERFSLSVIWRFFDRREITFKKKTAHAEEQQRPDVLKRRQEWFGAQLDLDPRKLVFIDETGASTNLARKGGRCRRGRRLRVGVPHGHYKTITLVAGLRLSGLVAQKAYDRPMNAVTFEDWVEKCLVPTLSRGDVVVMDNLSSHKGARVEQLIKAAGAELLYLPPYSPDMNPIEKAYSKLKAFLRKIAERTVTGLLNALEACAEIFKPGECANYFKACGYDTD